nr:Uncharacterized protein conserved in bacteria [Klebsiella pneumoniae]
MEKRRRRDARNHLRTRSRCPFSLASEYCHPAGGWPFLPFHGVDRVITLLAGQPLRLCGENIDQPLALWQPWAFPGEWALSSVGIVAPGLDFNIMTQRGRASATVRSLATCNALPARGRLCSTRRVGSGRATLRGRQRPLLARWIPAESASRGQQWTPAAGGDRAQIIVRRDDILQLSRCTFARAARTG